MRVFIILVLSLIGISVFAQSNKAFHIALASEVEALKENSLLVVKYNKSGSWGSYEGGTMTFETKGDEIHVKLSNSQNHSSKTHESSSAYPRSVLVERLSNYRPLPRDPDDLVIENYINYEILKDGRSVGFFAAQLTPEEVIHRVQLNPNLSDFFNQGRSKKGIIINN